MKCISSAVPLDNSLILHSRQGILQFLHEQLQFASYLPKSDLPSFDRRSGKIHCAWEL